jgi:hypothetical protein
VNQKPIPVAGITAPDYGISKKMTETEDISREKLKWLIEHVDEMFLDLERFENET